MLLHLPLPTLQTLPPLQRLLQKLLQPQPAQQQQDLLLLNRTFDPSPDLDLRTHNPSIDLCQLGSHYQPLSQLLSQLQSQLPNQLTQPPLLLQLRDLPFEPHLPGPDLQLLPPCDKPPLLLSR